MNKEDHYEKALQKFFNISIKPKVFSQKDFIRKKELDLRNISINGDIFKVITKIPDNSIELIICDPPYNISQDRIFVRKECADLNLNFGDWDFFTKEEYIKFLFSLLKEYHRILSEKGTLYLFISDRNISFALKYCEDILNMVMKTTFVWTKPNPPPRFLKKSFSHATEFCIVLQKTKQATFHFLGQKEMINHMNIPIVSGYERLKDESGKTLHPTQKPKELIRKFILISSNEGDLIADFMAGTFTTSVVAKEENRYYIAIERDKNYFKHGLARLNSTKLKKEYRLKGNKKKLKKYSKSSLLEFF